MHTPYTLLLDPPLMNQFFVSLGGSKYQDSSLFVVLGLTFSLTTNSDPPTPFTIIITIYMYLKNVIKC